MTPKTEPNKQNINETLYCPMKKVFTDEQIEDIAFFNARNRYSLGMPNQNLFPMIFKWEKIDEFSQKLLYTSLYSFNKNYAPTITIASGKTFLHRANGYKDISKGGPSFLNIYVNMGLLGNVLIPAPQRCKVTILFPYNEYQKNSFIISDNSYLLKIEYTPDIEIEVEESFLKQLALEKEKREKEELETMKQKILERERKKELKAAAMKELLKEGKIKK